MIGTRFGRTAGLFFLFKEIASTLKFFSKISYFFLYSNEQTAWRNAKGDHSLMQYYAIFSLAIPVAATKRQERDQEKSGKI